MAREKKEAALTPEERLQAALVPDWEWPYKLPGNWCWTTVGAINQYVGISADPTKAKNKTFELYSVPSSADNYPEIVLGADIGSTKQSVKKGDVLLCKINPRINRVWKVSKYTDHSLLASSEWIVIRNSGLISNYLMWCFRSPYFRGYMLSNVSGVGGSLMRAQPKFVQGYPVPVPPLPEQQRMPVIVRELSDDEAVIAMVDANLQRETILPSEKAFAYKMKLDAIKHQGIASVQVAEKLLSVEKVADDAGESKDQVRRYIRLTYLIPELLSMVDDGKIAFNPAVELSYLDSYQQRAVLDAMALNDCTPSHAQSIRLKKLAQEGLLDDQMIYTVLAETKPNQQEQLKFKREELRKYFPSGYTEEQMRRDIIKGLELLKRQRERNRDAR